MSRAGKGQRQDERGAAPDLLGWSQFMIHLFQVFEPERGLASEGIISISDSGDQ